MTNNEKQYNKNQVACQMMISAMKKYTQMFMKRGGQSGLANTSWGGSPDSTGGQVRAC